MPDVRCGAHKALLGLLPWVDSDLLACIGLAWGLPGRLAVTGDSRPLPEGGISGVLRTRPVGNPRKAREGRDYLREASVFWYRLVGPRC
jgi:hypothetical protein